MHLVMHLQHKLKVTDGHTSVMWGFVSIRKNGIPRKCITGARQVYWKLQLLNTSDDMAAWS